MEEKGTVLRVWARKEGETVALQMEEKENEDADEEKEGRGIEQERGRRVEQGTQERGE